LTQHQSQQLTIIDPAPAPYNPPRTGGKNIKPTRSNPQIDEEDAMHRLPCKERDLTERKIGFNATCTKPLWMFPKMMGTPKSSILIGFSIIFTIHFGGVTPIFGNTLMAFPGNTDWFMFLNGDQNLH